MVRLYATGKIHLSRIAVAVVVRGEDEVAKVGPLQLHESAADTQLYPLSRNVGGKAQFFASLGTARHIGGGAGAEFRWLTRDYIDYPAHGICPIDGRSRAVENLDALDIVEQILIG